MTTPIIIAHRGDAARHPENSLAALSAALAGGVRHVECDLQVNASGSLVVLHDANFERTHQLKLSVFDHVDAQPPELPTARDVLKLTVQYPGATIYFEIKHDSIEHWGEPHVLEKLEPLRAEIGPHGLFTSSVDFAAQARSIGFPRVGVILREWSDAVKRQVTALAPEFLVINLRRVPEGELLWPGPWQWAVYEVGDLATADAWGERGADFAISFNAVELHQQQQARVQ